MEGSYSNFVKKKGSLYIAQYPVRWTAQSALHMSIRGFFRERSWDLFSSYATSMIFLSALIVKLDYSLMIV